MRWKNIFIIYPKRLRTILLGHMASRRRQSGWPFSCLASWCRWDDSSFSFVNSRLRLVDGPPSPSPTFHLFAVEMCGSAHTPGNQNPPSLDLYSLITNLCRPVPIHNATNQCRSALGTSTFIAKEHIGANLCPFETIYGRPIIKRGPVLLLLLRIYTPPQ